MDGVEEIGAEAFRNCTNLKTFIMADSINKLGSSVFRSNYKLEDVYISRNLKEIPYTAFWGCQTLKTIELNNVENIIDAAFKDCTQLEHLEIPPSVKLIGAGAFFNCPNLNIEISPSNNSFVKKNGFMLNKDESAIVFIAQEAVNNNKLTIPNTISNLTNIGYHNLQNIKVIEIPSSVTSINNEFFSNRIPDIELNVSADNATYITKDNGVYSKDGTILYNHYKNATSISVPEGVGMCQLNVGNFFAFYF